jgi:lysophospholipase L1-like esterase
MVMVGGTIVAAELIVRLAVDPPGLLPGDDDAKLMVLRGPMGYALAPGATGHHTAGGRKAAIRINAWGFRDGPFDEAVAADLRVLGVGDSFTLGLGVDSTDPWPQRLEQLLRERTGGSVRVVNAGVPGYSARQLRQVVEAVVPKLRPQIVVFGVAGESYWRIERPYVLVRGYLIPTDIVPDLHLGSRGIYSSPISRWVWLRDFDFWMNEQFELGAHLLSASYRLYEWVVRPPPHPISQPETIEISTAVERLVPTMDEIGITDSLARQAGFTLVVLLRNSQRADGVFEPDQFIYNQVLRRFCEQRGIRVVDPLPQLVEAAAERPIFRTADDYHWTRAAHLLVAQELERYLVGNGLVPGSTLTSSVQRGRH